MRNPQPGRTPSLLPERLGHRLHRVLHTGDHHGGRPVDSRDRRTRDGFQALKHLRLGGLHRHHGATRGKRLHQPATSRHQHTGILQREHPRHMRRSHLTDRMPGHELRPHTPRRQKPEQSHLNGEQPSLSKLRPVQRLGVLTPHHLTQRTPQQPVQHRTHGIERLREHREPRIQLTPHPQPLRTLPREQEGRTAGLALTHDRGRVGLAHAHSGQTAYGGLPLVRQDHGAVIEVRALRGEGVPQVHRAQGGVGLDTGEEPCGLRPQCLRRPPGQRQRHHTRSQGSDTLTLGLQLSDRFGLFQDEVGVGATDTERGDTRPAHTLTVRPLPHLGQQLHRSRRPVHMRRRSIHMQRPRQHPVPHRHHHLDHTRHTRGSLRMTQIRLHRPQPQRPVSLTPLPIGGQQRLGLDRVTQRRPRTVRLHHIHVRHRQTTTGQRLPNHPLLRRTVRRRQTIGRTILIDGRTTHHRQHPMTMTPRIRQTLQHHHPHTLGPAGTVRGVGECLAAAVG